MKHLNRSSDLDSPQCVSFLKLVSYKRLVTKAGFAEYVTITLESGFNDLDDSWSPDDSKTNQLSACHEMLVQICK